MTIHAPATSAVVSIPTPAILTPSPARGTGSASLALTTGAYGWHPAVLDSMANSTPTFRSSDHSTSVRVAALAFRKWGGIEVSSPSRAKRAALGLMIVVALGVGGCGESEGKTKLSKDEKYGIAEEVIEEEGFSHSAAQEAREAGEANGLSPQETAEMGAVAKHMGGK